MKGVRMEGRGETEEKRKDFGLNSRLSGTAVQEAQVEARR
jgi:hypothetical protein